MDKQMKEAYIYTYTNKLNGKVYIGSRSAYKGKAEDDFNIKYFSSSKDKEFREAMSNGELEGMIVLKIECENAGKKIVDIESKMITAFWDKYGKELSYNHHNNDSRWNTYGSIPWNKGIHHKIHGENHYLYGKNQPEEVKKKISEAKKGKIAWNKGKTGIYTDESLQKMKNTLSDKLSGENNPMYGKHHTEETKNKMKKPKQKFKWLTPDGEIKEMPAAPVYHWHPDWKLIKE